MSGVNKVILVGHLGKDPEIRHLESGVKVANFTLATSENYKTKTGEKVSQTEWHNLVLWRGLAELADKYLKKGNQIYVEGKLRSRSWDDKEGIKRYTTEIVVDNLTFLGGKESAENGESRSENTETATADTAEPSEGNDLPF